MPEATGPLVDTLLRRVRDPSGLATSRDFARSMLSYSQRMLNAGFRLVVDSDILVTEPFRQVYPVMSNFPDIVRVEAIREDDRDLIPTTTLALSNADRRWFRRVRSRFETWARIGSDLIDVHPVKDIASEVEIVYTTLTTKLVNDSIITEFPDDMSSTILQLAEVLLLIRMREFAPVTAGLTQLAELTKEVASARAAFA